ncbi:24184_t:CDS:2, partial [Dentiscutata erythropus]
MPQEIKCPTSDPAIHDQKRVTGGSRSHKKKEMDEFKHELFNPPSKSDGPSSINHNNVSEISEMARPRKVTYDSIDEASQHLAQLCDKAIDAEDRANRANQEEILCWCLYWKDFRDQLDEIIRSNGGKFGEKKARSMLYDTITLSLEAGHVSEISETARPRKKLPEVNTPSTPQITPAKADDNNLTDLKEEDFCGGGHLINSKPENKVSDLSFSEQCEEKGPIMFEAKPDSELIIKSIKHGNYELHSEWYHKNRNQLPYDPELAKLYSQNKLEYCLTCNTS